MSCSDPGHTPFQPPDMVSFPCHHSPTATSRRILLSIEGIGKEKSCPDCQRDLLAQVSWARGPQELQAVSAGSGAPRVTGRVWGTPKLPLLFKKGRHGTVAELLAFPRGQRGPGVLPMDGSKRGSSLGQEIAGGGLQQAPGHCPERTFLPQPAATLGEAERPRSAAPARGMCTNSQARGRDSGLPCGL